MFGYNTEVIKTFLTENSLYKFDNSTTLYIGDSGKRKK